MSSSSFRVTSIWLTMPSFKVMCAYLALVALARVWKRFVPQLSLRRIMVFYNFFCSLLSLVTAAGFLIPLATVEKSIFSLEPCRSQWMQTSFLLYFIAKNLELTDTVFMVLRHRTRQITWLHVYHHASMVLLGDYSNNVRWPSIALYLGVNSIIHIILYFYYGLTAAWPNAARPSWRRRLTEAQLLQFFVLLVFVVEGYLHHGFCPYGIAFDLTMIVLFGNFYYFAYLRPKSAKMAEGQKRD